MTKNELTNILKEIWDEKRFYHRSAAMPFQ